ncbi:MAG: ATP synthase F1 subunit delta [Actinobacteria bacterium]|nr:ATP synthase F1 subunit delta [Actinomycetota bacterium]
MAADHISGYASGLFELARAEGVLDRVEDELFALAQAVERSGDLRSALTDPELPIDRKQAVVDELIGGRASRLTVGVVQFIVSQGRADDLADIVRAMLEQAAASRDRALAEVRSAVPLDDQTVQRLQSALGKTTGKQVEVKVVVDPSVIGGIVARVGDTVIDGSIARRIQSVRQAVNTR